MIQQYLQFKTPVIKDHLAFVTTVVPVLGDIPIRDHLMQVTNAILSMLLDNVLLMRDHFWACPKGMWFLKKGTTIDFEDIESTGKVVGLTLLYL